MLSTRSRSRQSSGILKVASAPGPNTSRLGLAGIAGLLALFFSLRHSTFFTISDAKAIGVNISSVAIAAIGSMALVITGNVDLSIGSMYALTGMIVAQVAAHVSNPVPAVVVGLAAGLALGTFNGMLVRFLKISPLIVTIGLLAVYAGLAYVVSPDYVFGFQGGFIAIGRGELWSIPYPVIIAAAVMLIGGFILTRTVLGLRLYAIGGDMRAAERAGVRVQRVVLGAYALNGMLIGLIAILTTAQLASGTPDLGANFEFDVLTAVILGGVAFSAGAGRPLGVLIGVLTIGILNAGLVFEGLQSWWQQIAKGAILLLALTADQLAAARRARRVARQDAVPSEEAGAALSDELTSSSLIAQSNGLVAKASAHGAAVLEVGDVRKRFGAVRALDGISLTLRAGEVTALLGDNGAGKSTLVKIMSGVIRPDQGTLVMDGRPLAFHSPADARAAGLETVYQDLALCPNLSVVHNLMLGSEPTRRVLGLIRIRDDKTAAAQANRRLEALGIRLPDLSVLVESLSGGQRQAIAVARVLEDHVQIVCLDEPTAALGVAQTANLLKLVQSVADSGTSVVMITHDIESVMKASDRIIVLRHGRIVHEGATAELTQLDILQLMAGLEPSREDRPRYPSVHVPPTA